MTAGPLHSTFELVVLAVAAVACGDAGQAGSADEPGGDGAFPAPSERASPSPWWPVLVDAPSRCAKSSKVYAGLKAWECVPSNVPPKAGLVVALHGFTQEVGTSWGYDATSQWDVLGEKHKFHVLYVDKGGAAFSWYAPSGTTGIGRDDPEPAGIAQMVKDFVAAHDVDPEKVFVNGLSAGAYMAVVLLATHPDVFAGGSTFAGGAYGCGTGCVALGKKGAGWSWPGDHPATFIEQAYPPVWNDPQAKKPRLLAFQGDADTVVTSENLLDLTQQWTGALGITDTGTRSVLHGHAHTEYVKDGVVMYATVAMAGIGHGTPVDPGPGPEQGGWDPVPSVKEAKNAGPYQDWAHSAGIYGPYQSAKFWGLVP